MPSPTVRRLRFVSVLVAVGVASVVSGGCRGSRGSRPQAGAAAAAGAGVTTSVAAGATAGSAATTVPTAATTRPPSSTTTTLTPATTGTTTTTVASGAFASSVASVTAADLGGSWHPGCPLAPAQLRLLHMSYWGFDNQPHAGALVVNTAVTGDVLKIFARLFAEHFPIHQMQPIGAYNGSDPASMAADNTSGFNCRYAVPPGNPPSWSVHAFGEAIDVNTVENPYIQGGSVLPAAGAAFLDRSNYRPGMAVPGGQLVQAFAAVGWQWGGRWATPDYQHFSKTGG